jgi:hypothetical protein
MPEKADIAIIIVQRGFGSYRDLALWTKKREDLHHSRWRVHLL